MSNPTFSTGNITRAAGATLEPFRLVKTDDGNVVHNDAATFPYGVVTEPATPAADRPDGYVGHGLPEIVRVHTAQCVVKIATDGDIDQDAPVYAAADGHVAATGDIQVGIAHAATAGNTTKVHLFHPAALISASTGGESGN